MWVYAYHDVEKRADLGYKQLWVISNIKIMPLSN